MLRFGVFCAYVWLFKFAVVHLDNCKGGTLFYILLLLYIIWIKTYFYPGGITIYKFLFDFNQMVPIWDVGFIRLLQKTGFLWIL